MTTEQQNRKNQHVSIAESFYHKETESPFKDLRFIHHSFPNMAVGDVDLSTSIGDIKLDYPFYINAMTGGSEWTKKLNASLSRVAAQTGIAMAVGSQSVAIREPEMIETFSVARKENPNGIIFANVGANHNAQAGLQAIEMLQADALQVHINAPQEIVMPEGDRDFSMWLDHFQGFIDHIQVPIIFKEVGFGFSKQSIQQLKSLGAGIIDLGGRGGTNFAQIENFRRKEYKYDDLLDWGQTTPESLLEAQDHTSSLDILASGGVRTAMDITKSLALGAKAVGIAGEFLHTLIKEDESALIEKIEALKEELAGIYTLLGAQTTQELTQTDIIVSAQTKDYCQARGIDYQILAQRCQ